jgi:hypothetical protein
MSMYRLIGAGVFAAATAVIVLLGVLSDTGGRLLTRQFSVPVGEAGFAGLQLHLGSAPTTIEVLPGGDTLLAASLTSRDDPRLLITDGGSSGAAQALRKSLVLEQAPEGKISRESAAGPDEHWEISLSDRIPLDLEINVSQGSLVADLADARLASLVLSGGGKAVELTLPASTGDYGADIDVGSARLEIRLSGTGEGGADRMLTLTAADDGLLLQVPGDIGLRLEGEIDALARLDAPPTLSDVPVPANECPIDQVERYRAQETAGFRTAVTRITVRVVEWRTGAFVLSAAGSQP